MDRAKINLDIDQCTEEPKLVSRIILRFLKHLNMWMHRGFDRLQLFFTKVFKDYRCFWPPVLVSSRPKFLWVVQRTYLLLQSDFIHGCYSIYCNINLFLEVHFIFKHKYVFLKYWKPAVFSCQEKWENGGSLYLHLHSIFFQRIEKHFENRELPKIQGIFSKRLCDICRSIADYTECDEGDAARNLWPPGFTWERKPGRMENNLYLMK